VQKQRVTQAGLLELEDARLSADLLANINQFRDKLLVFAFDMLRECFCAPTDIIMMDYAGTKNDLEYICTGPFNGKLFRSIVAELTTPTKADQGEFALLETQKNFKQEYDELLQKIKHSLS